MNENYILAALAAEAGGEQGARTREVIFYTGAKVERYDWYSDEWYDLSFDMETADLSEIVGAPVLNGHMTYQAQSVIGVVESARRTDAGYQAVLRFSEAADVDDIWQRIAEGTLRNVSMGVKFERPELVDDGKKSGRKHRMAKNWTPYEISVVPLGADPGAKFLAADMRLEKLRAAATKISAESGAASEAVDRARHELALRNRRWRVLGR